MTSTTTTSRRGPLASHAYAVPVVRELPPRAVPAHTGW